MVGGGGKRALRKDYLASFRSVTLQEQEKNAQSSSNDVHIFTASVNDIEDCNDRSYFGSVLASWTAWTNCQFFDH